VIEPVKHMGAGRFCFAVEMFRVPCSVFRVWEVTGLESHPPTWCWLQKKWILDVGVRLKSGGTPFRVPCSVFRVSRFGSERFRVLESRPPTWCWLQKTGILDVGVRLKSGGTMFNVPCSAFRVSGLKGFGSWKVALPLGVDCRKRES
jgi:hypothetical protein